MTAEMKPFGLRMTEGQREKVEQYMRLRLERDGVRLSINSALTELISSGLRQAMQRTDSQSELAIN